MNDPKLAQYLNNNFVCTFRQVSTFQVNNRIATVYSGGSQGRSWNGRSNFAIPRSRTTRSRNQLVAATGGKNLVAGKSVTRTDKNGGNVVSYFCDPSGRVLNFVVGPVSSQRLTIAGEFSQELNRLLAGVPKEKQALIAREIHAQQVHLLYKTQLEIYLKSATELLRAGDIDSKATIVANAAFHAYHKKPLSENKVDFSSSYNAPRFNTFGGNSQSKLIQIQDHWYQQSKSQNRPLKMVEHAFLSQLPLSDIRVIEKPVIQILVGQKYSTRTSRNREILDIVNLAKSQRKPIFMIVEPTTEQRKLVSQREQRLQKQIQQSLVNAKRGGWNNVHEKQFFSDEEILNYRKVRNILRKYELIQVNYDELFTLLNDLKIAPIMKQKPTSTFCRFVLFDKNAELSLCLDAYASPIQIERGLAQVAKVKAKVE